MKKASAEAIEISRYIAAFLDSYAPTQKTASSNKLKSYRYALLLYIKFLEVEERVTPSSLCKKDFERPIAEKWLVWLRNVRGCSPETCNIRLGSLRAFLSYLGSRKPEYLYLFHESNMIPLMKVQKKKVNGMTKEAVKALMGCSDVKTQTGKLTKPVPMFYWVYMPISFVMPNRVIGWRMG